MLDELTGASAMVFDCDGCLLDSMGAWYHVENSLIEMSGDAWSQAEIERMRAASMTEASRIFHEEHGVLASTEAVTAFMRDTMWEYYTTKAEVKPGVKAFLAEVRELNIPCCVVSSTAGRYLKAGLTCAGIYEVFDGIFSTQEAEMSKQDPELYRMALRSLGSEAKGAWGFDDSLYAIRVMKSVGMSTVGTHDDDSAGTMEQFRAEATFAIESFEELL